MKIKSFLIIIYTIAGLFISILSSFLTYIIIGKPIGMPMVVQIVFVIIFLTPVIGVISFFLGRYLSNKFNFIKNRLEDIKGENYTQNISQNKITEIEDINHNMNFLSAQLKNLIEDLKQKNQNLSNLLISMAHDIKTPITIVNGYIEEIEDGMISEEDLPSVLEHMREEIKFLDELTVDMLKFITSMQEHKKVEEIHLHKFISKEVFPILQKKENITFINDVDDFFIIKFNKIDLKKVCLNILTNALKFTNSGYIKVYTDKENILFENNGEKIEEEFKEKIFEPFFTISKSKNRKKSGFGLGLSIVNNLCQNNQYICYLYSSSKEKTIFNVKIKEK
ncbi:MAG TPA: HAMP domain-containing histidine kinase [Sulfurospirillum arcachonense]|nr:HAMP domain-containing histidine kinase [Sulfurospirillum arcachonense]HIP45876.1 HAMP domain-containing histidine kinase [Sulfurospirillum arcachonense]